MSTFDRFRQYTSGQEPVITVNLAAAFILGIVVVLTERIGVEWDTEMLSLGGLVALVVATWLARSKVFSPATYEADVDAALHEEPPK